MFLKVDGWFGNRFSFYLWWTNVTCNPLWFWSMRLVIICKYNIQNCDTSIFVHSSFFRNKGLKETFYLDCNATRSNNHRRNKLSNIGESSHVLLKDFVYYTTFSRLYRYFVIMENFYPSLIELLDLLQSIVNMWLRFVQNNFLMMFYQHLINANYMIDALWFISRLL